MPSKQVLYYIEKAVRQRVIEAHSDATGSVIEDMVTVTMKYSRWSKEALYLAIELAIKDQAIPTGYKIMEDPDAKR